MDESFPANNTNNEKKRTLSSDEEEVEPTTKKAVSVRLELNMPAQSPPEQAGETHSVSGKTTPGGTGEVEWTTVGGNSPRRPLNPSTSSSAAPSAAVPSTPLAKNVKGGGKAGSSGPSEDKRSAVSNKPIRPKKNTGPDLKNWR